MADTVFIKNYIEPPFDMGEIFRYMGCKEADPEVLKLVEGCIEEVRSKLTYRVCYRQFAMEEKGDQLDLTFVVSQSEGLRRNLKGCKSLILFAATIGLEIDRLIARYGRLSPAKALCFQAIGAERIESLCKSFNDDMIETLAKSGLGTRPRFSPGYGDFPLEVQKEIFRVLNPAKNIGLSLNDSLLMTPSKSVTAIIGITDGPQACIANERCDKCDKIDCSFRRL